MKINLRLLLITFTVIVIISLSSTFIYYSTTTSLLKKQYSQSLLNARNDFAFELQSGIKVIEEDFLKIIQNSTDLTSISLDSTNLDFIFTLNEKNAINQNSFVHSKLIQPPAIIKSIEDFVKIYPNIILLYAKDENSKNIFYGKVINEEYLDKLALKIRAEIAFLVDDMPNQITNSESNNYYITNFINANKQFNSANKIDVYYEELDSGDFFASIYRPRNLNIADVPTSFLIFNTPTELYEFRRTIQMIMLIITLAGVLLSLIFVLLFTTRLRKQISLLSKTTKLIAGGELNHRVPIISRDELGQLGTAFNDMLDRLEIKEKIEKRYLDIVTIINENPSLNELSSLLLEKLIGDTDSTFGAFYLVDEDKLKPISTYGVSEETLNTSVEPDLYTKVIQKQEIIEIIFEKDFPSVKTGLLEINIKYLLVIPIVFDKKVIAVIEIASEHEPSENPKEYLESIKEQLAIGINNAASLEQLKNLVNELKVLNEQYQQQNEKIIEQNIELKKLHKDLQEKAEELEEQRKKAVELTHVKSQFLANMSHELRTPLNSIIGLTELISEDSTTFPKTKDRLKIVLRNGKKLLAMINNILEFSKIESGKYEITKSDFIVSEFLNDIFLAMEPLVAEKELQLSIVYASDSDLMVNTDKHKLEQIILNLVSNAIKFTEVGGIKINVDIIEERTLKIDIIDTGIGISDENKKLIFEEFKQVDLTRTRKYQGAGLGLAICRKYIELLGGSISVKSNEFKGTTFSLSLPNIIFDKLPLLEKYKYSTSELNKQGNRKKLLLIHDDAKNKVAIENYFEKSEYDVIQSKPNLEIIEQLENVDLDGIIINATNITNTYWDILYELKRNQLTTDIPLSLIAIQPNSNKLYLFDTFEIIIGLKNIEKLKYCLDLVKLNNNNGKKILWLGEDSIERENLIKQMNSFANITLVSEIANISEDIDDIKPDVLIIDTIIRTETTIKLISYLQHSYKIPIIATMHEIIDELDKQRLINAVDTMLMDFGKNPEEVFKTIDRKFSLMKKLKKSISFPIENKNLNENKEVVPPPSVSEPEENDFHVLIVDDDKDTLFTVGEIIKNLGCSISFANNGAECLELLKTITPDLILLDIMMPVLDGFETIKKIRSDKGTKNLTVYAMTAQAMLDDFDIIKNSGFDDLITKPIDTSTLSFKIQQRIQQILK